MNKMRALKDFDDEPDGAFKVDEEFLVDDERCRVLTRKGKAVRIGAQTAPEPPPAAVADAAEASPVVQYGTAPRPPV